MLFLQLLEIVKEVPPGFTQVTATALKLSDDLPLGPDTSLSDGNMFLDQCKAIHEGETIHRGVAKTSHFSFQSLLVRVGGHAGR